MTKKKPNVFLSTSSYCNNKTPCGHMSVDEMNKFLEQIKNTDVPSESCIYSVYASTQHAISMAPRYKSESENLTISLYHTKQKCKIRDEQNCAKCIASGKCRDEFVINLIGKTLFADKYQK